ncbi:hypothetical protein HPB50_000002 [Hyalomma asiaticum]|uniref:Uncharacterized protein n=1 Tax=Hyalomma asiaticum TaxID=266040 RepID=A0ACB7RZQ2_HYAAI|nr:hypothetical protein HPB50_000002 [Hyalomma asiaticum]
MEVQHKIINKIVKFSMKQGLKVLNFLGKFGVSRHVVQAKPKGNTYEQQPQVLSVEDEKLFGLKYVRKAPQSKSIEWMDEEKLKGPDGSFRLHVGRVQLVLLRRFLVDLQKFLEPFLQPDYKTLVLKAAEKVVHQKVADLTCMMLQLCIDVHAPTVLLPQKSDSPNLLVLSLGDLSIENFFKEISLSPKPDYVDNILVRLSSLHMTRAIVLLDGRTQPQESILEPMKLNVDIKRALTLFNRNVMEYEIRGTVDLVKGYRQRLVRDIGL